MSDIELVFARIRGEAEQRDLPGAEQIRRRDDRRARRRAVGAFAAVVVGTAAVIGVLPLVNSQAAPPPAGPAPAPSRSASPDPSPEPSPESDCLDRYPAQIPTSVFLTEVNADNALCYTPPGRQPVLPEICARTGPAGDTLITDRRGFNVMYSYQGSSTPRVYSHTVTKYSGNGARTYLAELRQAADRCGEYIDGVKGVRGAAYEYAIVSGPRLGDESIRLRMRRTLQDPVLDLVPRSAAFSISVVRKGTYVSVVFDQGWEGNPSDPAAILDVMRKAAERLPAN